MGLCNVNLLARLPLALIIKFLFGKIRIIKFYIRIAVLRWICFGSLLFIVLFHKSDHSKNFINSYLFWSNYSDEMIAQSAKLVLKHLFSQSLRYNKHSLLLYYFCTLSICFTVNTFSDGRFRMHYYWTYGWIWEILS